MPETGSAWVDAVEAAAIERQRIAVHPHQTVGENGVLTHYGLPDNTALQQMTGTVPAAVAGQSQQVTFDAKPAPATLPPPGQRWTADRMGKAIRIALGSVVFRHTDQKLTPAGVWTMTAGRA